MLLSDTSGTLNTFIMSLVGVKRTEYTCINNRFFNAHHT